MNFFFFSSRRRHTRLVSDWSSDVCSSDLPAGRARAERLARVWAERRGVLGWLTTTDHKRIGLLYLFTSLAFFAAGGVEALLIRTQLVRPDNGLLSPDAYNQ